MFLIAFSFILFARSVCIREIVFNTNRMEWSGMKWSASSSLSFLMLNSSRCLMLWNNVYGDIYRNMYIYRSFLMENDSTD